MERINLQFICEVFESLTFESLPGQREIHLQCGQTSTKRQRKWISSSPWKSEVLCLALTSELQIMEVLATSQAPSASLLPSKSSSFGPRLAASVFLVPRSLDLHWNIWATRVLKLASKLFQDFLPYVNQIHFKHHFCLSVCLCVYAIPLIVYIKSWLKQTGWSTHLKVDLGILFNCALLFFFSGL